MMILLVMILGALVAVVFELKLLRKALTYSDFEIQEPEYELPPVPESIKKVYNHKKTVVYNPTTDPISEFSGKRDDWYGEENE